MLFKSHFKGMVSFAMKYLKDIDTSREIVQEVFLNLWEKKDNIDKSLSLKSYLMTSVYNRSLNYLRDNKKFNRDILVFEHLLPMAENVGDSIITAELENKLKTAIDELPEKCREIFLLSRYQNLKYSQIAEKLNISVKTVEAQMTKALKHLRIKLAEYLTLIVLALINFIENMFLK